MLASMSRLSRLITGPTEAEILAAMPKKSGMTLTPTAAISGWTGWGVGLQRLVPIDWAPPATTPWSREAAMSVPTVSRARDLICSAVGSLPMTLWRLDWDTNKNISVEAQIPPANWMFRPDPTKTRNWILAWTVDDLFFHARAYWRIVARYAQGNFPQAFQRMPATEVHVDDDGTVRWNSEEVDPVDVVEFLSPTEGLLANGWRAINTAVSLDAAADRFSLNEVPSGWLKQTGGEPLSPAELDEMAAKWTAARLARTTAALNEFIDFHEATYDPERMQLMEARQHQALELARLANVPAFLVSAPTSSGMTYQNAQQARMDLIDFGALPFINCVEQTLSGPNVVPNRQFVRFDMNAWLRNPLTPADNAAPNDAQIAVQNQEEAPQ